MKSQTKVTRNNVIGTLKVLKSGLIIQTLDGERIRISEEGIPEGMVLPPVGSEIANCTIRLNGTSDVIWGWGPVKGKFIARFVEFAAGRDEDGNKELPEPRFQQGGYHPTKTGKGRWYAPDKYTFTPILEILNGDFKGCRIGVFLDYAFERDSSNNAYINAGKKMQEMIENFLVNAGFDMENEDIPYSENILPDLQMILAKRSKKNTMWIEVEGGYVKVIDEVPAGMDAKYNGKSKLDEDDEDLDDDEEEEVVLPKKSKKVVEDDEDEDEVPAKVAKKSRVVDPDEDEDDEDDEEEDVAPKSKKSRKSLY